MSDTKNQKIQEVFKEIMMIEPNVDWNEIRKRKHGRLRFPMYINEKMKRTNLEALELSVRSEHCLHRANYMTIADLVEGISCREDLKRIRNCGDKSVDEIMDKLFCYQYEQLSGQRKARFIVRLVELNVG